MTYLSVLAFLVFFAVQLPPKRFDHIPGQRVVVIEGTQSEVHRICRKLSRYSGSDNILACALPMSEKCVIVWPKGVSKNGSLWRHERSHCNGWRH